MAFNNEIRVLNTSDTNHADNFNEPMQQLLENTQFNAKQIDVLNTNVGDTSTLKTSSKEVVGAINKNVDEITALSNKIDSMKITSKQASKWVKVAIGDIASGNMKHESFIFTGGGEENKDYSIYVGTIDFDTIKQNINLYKLKGDDTWNDIFGYVVESNKIHIYVKTARYHGTTPFSLIPLGTSNVTYVDEVFDTEPSNIIYVTPKKLATTDKIDISIPYNAEFITNEENRYVSKLVKTSLNKVTAYVSVKRTDGQMFKANTDYQIAILPIGWKNKGNNHCVGSASNLNGISIGTARMAVYDGTLFATTFTDCYSMMFTGEYELIV